MVLQQDATYSSNYYVMRVIVMRALQIKFQAAWRAEKDSLAAAGALEMLLLTQAEATCQQPDGEIC